MSKGISPEELAARYPRLYHVARCGSWPAIQRHGLLSTAALLDLFEVSGGKRRAIESRRRPCCITIEHPVHGAAVIRDQMPMDDAGLIRALQDGLTPQQWYQMLNNKVFFWMTPARLESLLNARAYRGMRQTVLVVDTAALLARHLSRVVLSPINSGCTRPFPSPRGAASFLPLADYPFKKWERARRRVDPVVELAVEYAVPDIRDLVVSVKEVGAGKAPSVLLDGHP